MKHNIQLLSAPSILGLRPGGVEKLGQSLLDAGLKEHLPTINPLISVPELNHEYSTDRDKNTHCLNPVQIRRFSIDLMEQVIRQINARTFPLVLGGDCSILIGIMAGLKKKGKYGLIFIDAHADFYEPEKSATGELADMDLAIITGRGPEILTNIQDLKPYVEDQNVIHIGQRDAEETERYGSRNIRSSRIKCFDLDFIRTNGLDITINHVLQESDRPDLEGFWIHFDCDVINDDENPAVDYRLPGGLSFTEVEKLLSKLLEQNIVGLDVTIFNPSLDETGEVAKKISRCLSNAFQKS